MTQVQYANLVQQAQQFFAQRQYAQARRSCDQLLKIKRQSPEAHMLLADIAWVQARQDDAIIALQKYIRLYPGDAHARFKLGQWLRHRGRTGEAVAQFEKILKQHPGNASVLANLARSLAMGGDNLRAGQLLQPGIDAGTENWEIAGAYLVSQLNQKNWPQVIEVGLRHSANHDMPNDARSELWYMLGQAYERTNQTEKSFHAYQTANSINRPPFDAAFNSERVQELMDVFSKDNLATYPRTTTDSALAVLIIGQPRCGSTLIERIIASHPQAYAAGEFAMMSDIACNVAVNIGSPLPYPQVVRDFDQNIVNKLSQRYLGALRALNRSAARLTDKYLENWKHLGLIQMLLPGARVIDLRRDPVDNCLSCFTTNLGPRHPYSYDLKHLGLQYRAVDRIMQHWHNVLDLPILQISYEDIVADQETWTRRIIDFCGLEWNDACLAYHTAGERGQQSAAPTLSYNQVRQPLYKTSVGRAQQFADYLGPLHEGLEEGARFWQQRA